MCGDKLAFLIGLGITVLVGIASFTTIWWDCRQAAKTEELRG